MLHCAGGDLLGGNHRSAGDRRRSAVHALENGVVRSSEPKGKPFRATSQPGVQPLHAGDELGIVDRGDLIVCGRPRRNLEDVVSLHEAQLPDAIVGEQHPLGAQGM